MQDTEPTAPVEAHPEVEPLAGAMMSASGDVWTTEGWCDLGTTSAGGGGGIGHSMTVWAKCWCDEGFEKVEDGEVDWQAETWVGPTCACENGSSNEGCQPDVGDPGDPGDDEELPAPPPPDSVDVQIVCDSAVTRGETGGCVIAKEPETLTLSNVEWAALVFDVEPTQSGSESWYGPLVTTTEFEVVVQPDENFAHENGYVRQQVSSGPNQGLWYISDVTTDLHMVAIMNPDFLPGGTGYPATGDDAVACGASSADTVSVGFVDYNEECRFEENYLAPFETWVWDHETQHMTNAVKYIAEYEYPRWDIQTATGSPRERDPVEGG